MEKLIIEMGKYCNENLSMTDKEVKELQSLINEINILIKHSGEKITLDKQTFATYFTLMSLYKEIEGFNHAINYVTSYNKEVKN